jgi:phosphoribosylcarboxyaminoimidazole (NCAIR) mutase
MEIENLAGPWANATARPWIAAPAGQNMRDNYSQTHAVAQFPGGIVAGCFCDTDGGEEASEANARLIAHAVNNVERLEAENGLMREALEKFPGYHAEVTFAAVWKWLTMRDKALGRTPETHSREEGE